MIGWSLLSLSSLLMKCQWNINVEFSHPITILINVCYHARNASDLVLGIVRAKWLVEQPAIGCHELLEVC